MGNAAPKEDDRCLEEETIAAWIAGDLSGDDLARAESHVAKCSACRSVIADAAHGASVSVASSASVASVASVASGEVGSGGSDGSTLASAGTPAEPELPGEGTVLADKYRIGERLGQGGMGAVFSAQHLELGHRVAIKVLFRDRSDPQRFLREAQTCARLTSEHIVRVFDVGRLGSGAPYLVMEYLTGKDLGRLARRGPLPIAEAVDYVRQACAGLALAHAAGVVHRDLKPANLFVTARADGSPLVKVLDFGISKVLKNDLFVDHEKSLTTTHQLVGSPTHMSPEQLRDSKDVDVRSDIWSLGVILYRLLTGKLPFPGGRSLMAISLAITQEEPAPPSALSLDVPAELDAVVMRCLAKDRDRRFASVLELSTALETALVPLGAAEPAPPTVRAKRRMGLLPFIAGASIAAGVSIGVAVSRPRAAPESTPPVPVQPSSSAVDVAPSDEPPARAAPAASPIVAAAPSASALPPPKASVAPSPRRPPHPASPPAARSASPRAPGPTDTPD